MKTEDQVVQQLEKVADQLNKLGEEVKDLKSEEITEEKRQQILVALTNVATLGWVLGCEKEVKEMMRTIKLVNAIQSVAGVG